MLLTIISGIILAIFFLIIFGGITYAIFDYLDKTYPESGGTSWPILKALIIFFAFSAIGSFFLYTLGINHLGVPLLMAGITLFLISFYIFVKK